MHAEIHFAWRHAKTLRSNQQHFHIDALQQRAENSLYLQSASHITKHVLREGCIYIRSVVPILTKQFLKMAQREPFGRNIIKRLGARSGRVVKINWQKYVTFKCLSSRNKRRTLLVGTLKIYASRRKQIDDLQSDIERYDSWCTDIWLTRSVAQHWNSRTRHGSFKKLRSDWRISLYQCNRMQTCIDLWPFVDI